VLSVESQVNRISTSRRRSSSLERQAASDCHKLLGDRWSLLILHNMVLRKINSFTELLESGEGVATNVLSDRLKNFLAKGIITVRPHDSDGRKLNYALTAKGKALEPVLAEMVRWNAKYLPPRTREKGRRGTLAPTEAPRLNSL